ncbi:hypothetical protein PLICRDRAFT_179458 [Plicaturopsis crispa FD-325 SS-3]|uniref:Unplaced genomic scaffold PLICRscaffold_17, whole genome shotgun sequence n=1 Tax=Plicaturopsis crispa FD-325 SS-3 TaxID=944288 RepID=A0A0C9T8U2_PLICR|nr:hypothetical protein PLICRDRAFT_179458 [Plicaturopsis crispa FD-325 SS-3]
MDAPRTPARETDFDAHYPALRAALLNLHDAARNRRIHSWIADQYRFVSEASSSSPTSSVATLPCSPKAQPSAIPALRADSPTLGYEFDASTRDDANVSEPGTPSYDPLFFPEPMDASIHPEDAARAESERENALKFLIREMHRWSFPHNDPHAVAGDASVDDALSALDALIDNESQCPLMDDAESYLGTVDLAWGRDKPLPAPPSLSSSPTSSVSQLESALTPPPTPSKPQRDLKLDLLPSLSRRAHPNLNSNHTRHTRHRFPSISSALSAGSSPPPPTPTSPSQAVPLTPPAWPCYPHPTTPNMPSKLFSRTKKHSPTTSVSTTLYSPGLSPTASTFSESTAASSALPLKRDNSITSSIRRAKRNAVVQPLGAHQNDSQIFVGHDVTRVSAEELGLDGSQNGHSVCEDIIEKDEDGYQDEFAVDNCVFPRPAALSTPNLFSAGFDSSSTDDLALLEDCKSDASLRVLRPSQSRWSISSSIRSDEAKAGEKVEKAKPSKRQRLRSLFTKPPPAGISNMDILSTLSISSKSSEDAVAPSAAPAPKAPAPKLRLREKLSHLDLNLKALDLTGRNRQRKLVISGRYLDNPPTYDAVLAWCEGLGKVQSATRNKVTGDLYVSFNADDADRICRLRDTCVSIPGVSSTTFNIGWRTGPIP